MSEKTSRALLLGVSLLLVVVANTGPIANNDYGLHLRIGQEIAEAWRPVHVDYHSYTLPGARYPDHEWLTQLAFYGVHHALGDEGMVALRGLLIGIALAFMLASVRGPLPLKLGLLVLVMLLGFDHAHMRPHLLSWVMAGLLNVLLQRRINWAVLALLLFWGNTHGSVLLGVGIAGLHYVEAYARVYRERRTQLGRRATKKREEQIHRWFHPSLLWAACCALAPLLNPNGVGIYTLFFEISGHTTFIGEWQPYTPDTLAFWLLVGFVLVALYGLFKSHPFNWFDAVPLAVLALLAFQSSRNGVVATILLAPLFGRWYGQDVARWSSRARWVVGILLAVVLAVMLGLRIRSDQALDFRLDHEHLPVEAVEFMQRHQLEGPIFNDYNFGGYLLWKAWPEYPVFIDGRTEVYKGRVLEEYLAVSRAAAGWEDIVERYGVTFFLVRPEREISKVLLEHADWDLVYFDYNSVIYIQSGLFPELERLHVVSPYGHRDRSRVAEATEEITYLLEENPRFFGGYKILAFLLYRQGDYSGAREALKQYLVLHPEGGRVEETQSLMESLRVQGAWP
jgi:hypothetical protein